MTEPNTQPEVQRLLRALRHDLRSTLSTATLVAAIMEQRNEPGIEGLAKKLQSMARAQRVILERSQRAEELLSEDITLKTHELGQLTEGLRSTAKRMERELKVVANGQGRFSLPDRVPLAELCELLVDAYPSCSTIEIKGDETSVSLDLGSKLASSVVGLTVSAMVGAARGRLTEQGIELIYVEA